MRGRNFAAILIIVALMFGGAMMPAPAQGPSVAPVPSVAIQGTVTMQGGAAAGSPPVGNPMLIGGWDNTNMQRLLMDSNGKPLIAHYASDSTEAANGNNAVDLPAFGAAGYPLAVHPFSPYTYTHLTAGSTVVKASAGNLYSLVVNIPWTAATSIWDNASSCATTNIATWGASGPAAGTVAVYNLQTINGLCITVGTTGDVTVVWR